MTGSCKTGCSFIMYEGAELVGTQCHLGAGIARSLGMDLGMRQWR